MDGPRLPRELEREIFELAAEIHPSTVAVLLRVAHRVQEWTEPFLYRTIRVRTSQSFETFQHVLRTKPPNFLAASVRHVLFEAREGCTDEICLEIISKCPGITHIGTTINFVGPKALAAFQTLPNLTHLAARSSSSTVYQDSSFEDSATIPLCQETARQSFKASPSDSRKLNLRRQPPRRSSPAILAPRKVSKDTE
ncbi:hypothetical protein C8F01DRAFT_217943 [Mycena amicta]|nr:hypothetical protein C8F01DRAFT_217943 [Mycena amicta]